MHVVTDRESFVTYAPIESYVLTLAGDRRISVKGIGSVEVKVKKTPNRNDWHAVLLQDALHVPDWMCNIFSHIFFHEGSYDFQWTSDGVKIWEKYTSKKWGYTEDFFGLDRLGVVVDGTTRSVIAEEYETSGKEIWSVNLRWPVVQELKWKHWGKGQTE